MEAAKAILAGQLPAFYAHHDKDWQSYNAQLVARYRLEDIASMIEATADSHHQLIDFLKGIPPQEFDKDRGIRFRGYKVTIARLLEAEMKDETVHHGQIAAFKQQGGFG
jgi:hypothetical protein